MNFKSLNNWLLLPAILLGGIVVGVFIPFQQIRNAVAEVFELKSQVEDDEAEEADHLHVEITETAHKSLGLKVRRAAIGSYTSTYDIPATIKELPGASSIKLSSRFTGLIKRVFVSQGQSIRAGDRLFEMDLTGEELSRAQSELLLAIKKAENLAEEIARVKPLVLQGGLANKRLLELQYELKQLQAEVDTKRQELRLHGLAVAQIDSIVHQKQLVQSVTIRAPDNLLAPQLNLRMARDSSLNGVQTGGVGPTFIVEDIVSQPGTIVPLGGELCNFAFHETLVVEGHAFERDLPQIRSLFETQSEVTVEVGTFGHVSEISGCQVAFVSNHAKEGANTYPFFVYLNNQIDNKPMQTPSYLAWKWKPGQLAHIEMPKRSYDNMIVLPREAIAENGASRLVFEWKGQVEHDHDHADGEEDDHEHADEYVPIEVDVVYMDRKVAIVDPNGNLKEGTRIAFNNANHLLFAMQSGSGGHGHSHSHPH